MERGVNVLAFCLPGTGKTHALSSLGHRGVEAGRSVFFAPAYRFIQILTRRRPGTWWQPSRTRPCPGYYTGWTDNFDFLLLDDLG